MSPLIFSLLTISIAIFPSSRADLCETEYDPGPSGSGTLTSQNGTSQDDLRNTGMVIMTCPRPVDPPEFVSCCYGPVEGSANETSSAEDSISVTRCCPPPEPPSLFPFVSDKIALIIAITITTILTVLTVGIVFCCFSPRCPLYMACRVRYRQDDIIAYTSKDEETANLNDMPPEEKKGVKVYCPNAIKVTKTLDE